MGEEMVIVTTAHRGVFYGLLVEHDTGAKTAVLENAVMAIYWNTTRGLYELAADGPNKGSKLSAVAPSIHLSDVTSVIHVSEKAQAQWANWTK